MEKEKKLLFIALILILILIISPAADTENIKEKKKEEVKKIAGSTGCKFCHISVYFSWTNTTHYRGFRESNLSSDFSECESCHGPGGEHVSSRDAEDIILPDSFNEANRFCGEECHFNVAKVRNGIEIPIINPQAWEKSNHGQAELSCIECHKPHQGKKKVELQDNGLCLDCHNQEGAGKVLKETEAHKSGEDCLICHQPHGKTMEVNEFERKHVHYPVSENKCFSCHDTHRASGGKLTKEQNNELCYKCHKAKKNIYPDIIHSEAEGMDGKGLCINCHEPHSSNYKSLLKKSQTDMCRSCHYSQRSHHFLAVAQVKAKLTCIDCHNPHGENNKAFLKMKPDNICENCHEK